MANLLRYGWEVADSPAPTVGGTVTTSTEQARSGINSAKITAATSYSQWLIDFNLDTDYYVRMPFYISGAPSGLMRLCEILTAASGIVITLRLSASRTLQMFDSVGNPIPGVSQAVPTGQWHDVEMKFRISSSGQGIAGLRLNGQEVVPDTAATLANVAGNRTRIGNDSATTISAIYHDDIGINSGSGTANNTWQTALVPGTPVPSVNAFGGRNLTYPVGFYNVNNSVLKAGTDRYVIRFVPDKDITLYQFISGFNIEGVATDGSGNAAPPEVRPGSGYTPTPRTGYGGGNGGTIRAELRSIKSDGTPDLTSGGLLATETVNSVQRYIDSKALFGFPGPGPNQLLYFNMSGVSLAKDVMYAMVYTNVHASPLVNWFSCNSPVGHESVCGAHNRNSTKFGGVGVAGLDPRECVMWTIDTGTTWYYGKHVGGDQLTDSISPPRASHISGCYNGFSISGVSADDAVRLPWYGYRETNGGVTKAPQPYTAYVESGSFTLRCRNAARTVTVTQAGGYAKQGDNVGIVTVTNVTTGQTRTTGSLGTGLAIGTLNAPLTINSGDTYTISNSGSVMKAEGDEYIQATFGVGAPDSEYPFTTDGTDGKDFAQLFVNPWPYYTTVIDTTPTPTFVASEREAAHWKFLLVRAADLDPIGELIAARSRVLTLTLNRPGTATFNMPMDDDMAGLLSPLYTAIIAVRRGSADTQEIWSGYIATIDEDVSSNSMTVNAVGWLEHLNSRMMRRKKAYVDIDDGVIIEDLLAEANLTIAPDGYAIPVPPFSSPATPTWMTFGGRTNNEWVTVGANTAYVPSLLSNNYEPYTKIGPEITNITNYMNGCDIEVTPRRVLYVFRKKQRILDDLIFGYGWGPYNLSQFGRNLDGSNIANYFLATGRPEHSPRYADNTFSQAAYRIFEDVTALSDYKDESTLQYYAGAESIFRAIPQTIYTITPFPYGGDNDGGRVPEPFVDYRIGDRVRFGAKHPPRIDIDRQAVRVFGMTVNIDDQGNEAIGLQIAA